MNDPFARLGLAMVRLRWIVFGVWVGFLVVSGALLAPQAAGVMKSGGIVKPGSESDTANIILEEQFNLSTLNNAPIVFRSDTLTVLDAEYRREVEAATEELTKIEGVRGVFSFFNTGDPSLVSEDGRTAIAVVSLAGDEGEVQDMVSDLRAALEGVTLETYLTGSPALNHDFTDRSEHDLRRSEMVTIPVVLLLLIITFRTIISAAVPLVLGGAAVVSAMSILYVIGSRTDVSIFAVNVASMIGLGLGIDFSLIVVNRFREEMASGRDVPTATAVTMATAGRSITYSGVTVLLGMLVLTLMFDLLVIRSISLGVMLVALTALISGLTLLPALLAILGHRLDWLRVIPQRRRRAADEHSGVWYRFSHAIMARPWVWLAATVIVLLVIASPARQLDMLGQDPGLLPAETESVEGARILDAEFGENRLTPIQIVMQTDQEGGVWTPEFLGAISEITRIVSDDPRTLDVASLETFLRGPIAIEDAIPAGVTLIPLIHARVNDPPEGPGFAGFGRITLEPGLDTPVTSRPAVQLVYVESGSPTFEVHGEATINPPITGPAFGNHTPAPIGEPFTLGVGEQLVIPMLTPVSVRNLTDEPSTVLAVTMYTVRPTKEQGVASWIEGGDTGDLFTGLPRQVLSAGVVNNFPPGPVDVLLDRSLFEPGSGVPAHDHPGPELIYVEAGPVWIFTAPPDEMTLSRVDGPSVEPPYTWLQVFDGDSALAQPGAINLLRNEGPGVAQMMSLLILESDTPPSPLVLRPENPAATLAIEELRPELFTGDPLQAAAVSQFVNLGGRNDTAVINVVSRYGQYTPEHEALVNDLRERFIPETESLQPYTFYVGGNAASFQDFRDALYGRFPFLVGAVLLLSFVILMMFFQSVFLPFKAILMNIAGILATYGVLVAIFQWGWGAELLGFESLGAIGVVTPAILFVILFSLSTDYEVFMLSRVKEYYHELGDNDEAVARGLQHTAGVITAAGLILIGVFGSFATAGIITIKEIGLGLAIAVLIDTTIIRIIMVPATMRLMGDWNWWMPAWLKRIVPELREGTVPAPVLAPAMAMQGADGGVVRAGMAGTAGAGGVATTPRMAGQLRATGVPVGAELIQLPRSRPFVIGREGDADLQVIDSRVSRRHARIDHRAGDYVLTDLNSTNGVYVNGVRVGGSAVLRHGDQLDIANSGQVTFQFELRPLSEVPR